MSASPLPPLYDRWFVELTGESPTGEPEATCQACIMLSPSAGMSSFHPDTKCCTYTPALPNFLVGAALGDALLDEVGGRDSLRARIGRRNGVTPLGLERSAMTALIADHASDAFGKAPELRCPHYHGDTGNCGMWLHRNAVCSTWFCKHERGAVGMKFWHTLRDLLVQVELELSRFCVLELGAPYAVIPRGTRDTRMPGHDLTPSDIAGTDDDERYADRWGDWLGREEELYRRAAALVASLSWADVTKICGPEVGLCTRALEAARARRNSPVVPAALLMRKLEIASHGEPTILSSYNGHDPLAVPSVLLDVLPYFRGQPTEEAQEEIANNTGLELKDDLLVRLSDFEILVEPKRRG